MMSLKDFRNMCILVAFLLTGFLLGGIGGEALRAAGVLPLWAAQSHTLFELRPTTIDLYVARLTFGFAFTPSLASGIGVLLALMVFTHLLKEEIQE